jgi:uncharacterized LabA/DUF88 family protein
MPKFDDILFTSSLVGLRPASLLRVAIRRFFLGVMNRTVFLIDGFNLYHSVREAAEALGGRGAKWLNIKALCESYLHLVGGQARLENVYYFSALAKHLESRDPDVTRRHRTFLDCLRSTGVIIELARFKERKVSCPLCRRVFTRNEEKETDVAIAVRLLETFHSDESDTAIIMSGDTDIAPAVRTAQRLFPEKTVGFAFPYGRKNKELAQLVPLSFRITKKQYARFQFPDSVETSGKRLRKPANW